MGGRGGPDVPFILSKIVGHVQGILRSLFLSVCGFPVDTSFYSFIRIPDCLGVQKSDRSISFFFCKSDVLVDGVKMGVELSKIYRHGCRQHTYTTLRRVGCGI